MTARTYRTWTERRASRGTQAPRNYPISRLASAIGIDPDDPYLRSKLARALNLDPSWVRRCLQDGRMLTACSADHWAARAGLHADIVWPGWWDDPTDTDALPDEDDPPIDQVQPVTAERLAVLRAWRQGRAA